MSPFFNVLFTEFAARRDRMRAAFGDRNGTLLEFVLFAGVVAGVFAAILGQVRGLAAPAALILGYALLEISRQRALMRGADEDKVRKLHDRLVFLLFAAMGALGIAFLVVAMQPPPHQLTLPPPGRPLSVDLAPS